MNYDDRISQMRKTYEEVDAETIKKIWAKNISNELGIYIHSPFCPSACKYCAYQGTPENEYVKSYYEDYLLRQIDSYSDVIKTNNVITWFFGGGTPSLMSASQLRNVLSRLPKIKENVEKTFEVHPARYDPEIFDVLAEYGFKHILIGVQSFDEQTLVKQNRIPASYNDVKKIVEEVHKRGMNVWIDLIGYMNGDDQIDTEIYSNDIKIAMSLNPEEISAQLNYNVRTNDRIDLNVDLFYTLLNQPENSKWIFEFFDPSKVQEITKDLIKNILLDFKGIRLFNRNNFIYRDQRRFVESFVEENTAELEGRPSTLAIGSFQNPIHGTMSRVFTDDFIYVYTETNKDNSSPKYFITSTYNFFEESKKIMSDLSMITKEFKNGFNLYEITFFNKYQDFSVDENDPHPKGFAIGNKISGLCFSINWKVRDGSLNDELLRNKIIKYCKIYRGEKPYINLSKI